MPFDAYLTPVARRFMDSLTPDEQKNCNDTIINQLCYIASTDDAKNVPSAFPYGQGVVQRVVGNWTFTYKIANAATLEIGSIYYAPGHPKYPPLGELSP